MHFCHSDKSDSGEEESAFSPTAFVALSGETEIPRAIKLRSE
jgi:hypothetical protein